MRAVQARSVQAARAPRPARRSALRGDSGPTLSMSGAAAARAGERGGRARCPGSATVMRRRRDAVVRDERARRGRAGDDHAAPPGRAPRARLQAKRAAQPVREAASPAPSGWCTSATSGRLDALSTSSRHRAEGEAVDQHARRPSGVRCSRPPRLGEVRHARRAGRSRAGARWRTSTPCAGQLRQDPAVIGVAAGRRREVARDGEDDLRHATGPSNQAARDVAFVQRHAGS